MPRSQKYGRLNKHDDDGQHSGVGLSGAGRAASSAPDEGLVRFPGMGGGIMDDIERRRLFCGADYSSAIQHCSSKLELCQL